MYKTNTLDDWTTATGDDMKRMALAEAIKTVMAARGLSTVAVLPRLEVAHRTTFYRVLNGSTPEPRLLTFTAICAALDISPTELLQLANLWPVGERHADPLAMRLRTTFVQFQALAPDDKHRAITLAATVAHTLQEGRDATPQAHTS